MRRHWTRLVGALLLVVAGAALWLFWPERVRVADLPDSGAQYDVRILRDEWGVPHIFGQRDADVAYGLAYAHAEDDFLTIQQTILAAKGRLAYAYGAEAAPNDYMVHLLRIHEQVEGHYDALPPEIRALHSAYADGLTRYAALHPEEVLPGLFPLDGRDIAAGAVHKAPLFFGLERTLGDLFAEERAVPEATPTLPAPPGSNAFAVAPSRTADGSTFLAVNSHQPWEGPVAWYEAHVHSEEGWEAAGALFPGVPAIIQGHNRDLGWAFTVNRSDLIDVFRLEINPADPNQYRFDGEWRTLERRDAPITVRLLGRLRWTVHREVLWSAYGPTVRRDDGTYAVRYAGRDRVGLFEQLYRMNRARDVEEWLDAVAMQQIPTFNLVYADRTGTILYLYNGLLPLRAPGYDWTGELPGTGSETLWTEYLPFEELPRVQDPPSGFVQSANNSPFFTTVGPGNPDPAAYPVTLGLDPRLSNRALRLLDLLAADEAITWEEFKAIKYDDAYAADSEMARYLDVILHADLPDEPGVAEAVALLQRWDRRTDAANRAAAVAVLTSVPLGEFQRDTATDEEIVAAFLDAVRTLRTHFGRVDPRWDEVNRLVRGETDIGLGGAPDVVHAVYGRPQEDGRLHGFAGDSYVMLVRWGPDGSVHSESIHQYGAATLRPDSPHYADQAPLFAARQLKPVWFDKADVRAHATREYVPGEE